LAIQLEAMAPGTDTMTPPAEVAASLAGMRRPVVICHVRPDADALGSAFAVARAWRDAGRTPTAAIPEGSLSQRLRFMHEWAEVPAASDDDFRAADGFVIVDTARRARCNVGEIARQGDWSTGRPVLNIDHHETNERFGTVNWIVPHAGSTCELVYHLLQTAGRPIDAVTASMLYAGIHSDLLGFSLPTTSASALAAAADLVRLGADVGLLGDRLCRNLATSEFELVRLVYANTRSLEGGHLTYSTATFDEIQRTGCDATDIDDQISIPRSLNGSVISMLFTEGQPGRTRINFRSRGDVTIVELAQKFGGGGHAQAAGAIIEAGLQPTLDRVLPAAVEYLRSALAGSAGAAPRR
jgi:phosphoesterase RecJ-like protein